MKVMTSDRKTSISAADQQGRSAIRAEFHRLCAAARCRLPLFRGPEVLPSRRTLLRARLRDREGRKKLSGARPRTGAGFSVRQDRGSPQAADGTALCRPGIAPFQLAPCRLLGEPWAAAWNGGARISGIAGCASNRSMCRVRRSSAAALSELGVRVVKRSPDLTVTLVNDYLERRLAELNQQRVSERSRWLLVQPSGAFPLVGPVFSPGESACWTCLFDRMIRNREVKGFLDRGPARAVAASPLVRNAVGQSAIQFAALEDRQGNRYRLSHRIERSHRQPRSAGLDHRKALRGGAARNVRPAAARSCGTRAERRCRSSLAPAPSWS